MEINKSKFWIGLALAFVLGWGISYFVHTKSVRIEDRRISESTDHLISQDRPLKNSNIEVSEGEIPAYALETLEYIREHHEAPTGYVGGRNFKNREGQLPIKDPSGKSYRYQEWDVYPKIEGKNRGAERLVTSDQGEAYYTSDHYKSFKKIN